MTNTFEGAPDGRQSADQRMPTSRFRPRYRALSDEEKVLHDKIKDKASELEQLFQQVREMRGSDPNIPARVSVGRYMALADTELEMAIMWSVKGLTT